ncbi:MAG: TIR domain-containing protein [Clostridia bacterium]|nr:TIR domain-containing protein [Clostridia bacterium]
MIHDSTVTVVLISPNMKEAGKWQRSQWIPWEISYSIRRTTRGGRTSQRNSIIAVILPDKNGSCTYFTTSSAFPILRDNINNGYIYLTTWDEFRKYPTLCIIEADKRREATPEYKLTISLS